MAKPSESQARGTGTAPWSLTRGGSGRTGPTWGESEGEHSYSVKASCHGLGATPSAERAALFGHGGGAATVLLDSCDSPAVSHSILGAVFNDGPVSTSRVPVNERSAFTEPQPLRLHSFALRSLKRPLPGGRGPPARRPSPRDLQRARRAQPDRRKGDSHRSREGTRL